MGSEMCIRDREDSMNKNFENEEELQKFNDFAKDWWNPKGKMKPLHHMNPVRISYIKRQLCEYFQRDVYEDKPLKGIKILDVGCGGGILSESLTILGATVTGIDASEKMIYVAKKHAHENSLKIKYECVNVEDVAEKKEKYDVVTCLEVLEHVDDVQGFIEKCSHLSLIHI